MPCNEFFENEGIPYLPQYADQAVRAVKVADFYDPGLKKWLIMCWFDTTYGIWTGTQFHQTPARAQLSDWLNTTGHATIEQFLESPNGQQPQTTT